MTPLEREQEAQIATLTAKLEEAMNQPEIEGAKEGNLLVPVVQKLKAQLEEVRKELVGWHKLHDTFVKTYDGSKPEPEFLDDVFTDIESKNTSLQNKLKMAEKVLKDTKEAFIFWNKQIKSGTKILEFYLPKELDEALTAIKSEEGV